MNNQLYDVLEICLQEIENGADINTILSHYPEFAEDLRPILETSVEAKSLAVLDPSSEVKQRNRARILQQAAQMRVVQASPSRRIWSVPLRRAMVSLAVIAALFIGTNGLVYASSNTLPGDHLYPVKRTWEDVRVLLTFNTQARTVLEKMQETERLDELNDLFLEGRSASVDFAGTLTGQNGDLWLVANIPVLISPQTDFGGQPVKIGNAIRVKGFTQADGTVLAEHVHLLPAGVPLPDVDDDSKREIESEHSGNRSEDQNESNAGEHQSNDSSNTRTPQASETRSSEAFTSERSSLAGTVDSVTRTVVVVNGEPLDISNAEVEGTVKVGATAKVEGYYDGTGTFIVTKIEFQSSGADNGSSSADNGSSDNHNKGSDNGSNSNHGSRDGSGGGGNDSGSGSDD